LGSDHECHLLPPPGPIVVVDDDARIRDLLRRYLTQEGFDVLLAEDAKALARLLPARRST
jgi:two-component system phosphate regulon response regulator OmpR